jgi:hypothetical protein
VKRTNDDRVKRIALELSLKPFGTNDGRTYEECARHVITAWRPLAEAGTEVSFMLWVADGSDILEYDGDLGRPLEWARYIGFCNQDRDTYDSAHHKPSRGAIPYVDNPREMRYADLAEIMAALRTVGAELLGRPITIGATFDPGPEFAESPFKYTRHREIVVPKRVSGRPTFPMVDAAATLHGDNRRYAAYPDGIPEGEPFALFLGRQIEAYCRDLGVDYVWLSNGFGFSAVAWDYLGPGFDGETFLPAERAERLLTFKKAWSDLHRGNPTIPMEVRGSNFAAGMDIAKDGVDFAWLYEQGFTRLPPPNSPWGVLNYDFGLEIAGFLSRVVKSPRNEYLFRYYPNDPWFWQNPWTDIFYGQAYDIYVPLATSVVDASGAITTPSAINFLTVDSEFGETDPLSGVQVASHIRTALNDRPDDVGLVTWVYPFDEYHRIASSGAAGQAEVFFGDWFVRSLTNNGLPVASIATPGAFDALITARETAPDTVLLLPTAAAADQDDARRLLSWLDRGVPAMLYGPAASLHESVRSRLGLSLDTPLSGEFTLVGEQGSAAGRLVHDPVGSAGGLCEVLSEGTGAQLLHEAAGPGGCRAYSVRSGGDDSAPLYWIRGTNHFETRPEPGRLALKPRSRGTESYDTSRIGYEILGRLGYTVEARSLAPGEHASIMLFSRHENAWMLSGYAAAPAGFVKLRFPYGAPVFTASWTQIENGASLYPLARSMHHECRVFVTQERGVVGCDTGARDEHHTELTLIVRGLDQATVVFLPPPGVAVTLENAGRKHRFEPGHDRIELAELSGELFIRW